MTKADRRLLERLKQHRAIVRPAVLARLSRKAHNLLSSVQGWVVVAGTVAAVTAAFFGYLAVPRPALYVAQFQMIVDVIRHRAAFYAYINNAGGTADILFISVGKAVRDGMPTWQVEARYPGTSWHRLLPFSPHSVSVSFRLDDTEGFLQGRFGMPAELSFRARPTFLGGALFEDDARLSYSCKPTQIVRPPYTNEYYSADCALNETR